ncbi:glucosaminidase domain-containing protein [Shewanella surugensis]|uniref:Glucosaminidase domain-containing protein n=1 Tax=Shewanella surugensis TaxID=212020 RepID=A0ABT0L7T9_9GAMM|nr:glucosaminidase domain-containing protein [Shewanella surugensis]MCL1123754.1 glucosaminidase domain-containing protein [Shewanella surugensis]
MKTGKLGRITIVLGCVIILFVVVRLIFIPSLSTKEGGSQKLTKNATQANKIPNFADMATISEKKRAFFRYLNPLVHQQNAIISDERQFLFSIRTELAQGRTLTTAEEFRLNQITEKYQYTLRSLNQQTLNALLIRVDIIPDPLVLIQAAKESGWGSSRFAREGFNFFGQWCYKKGCGLVPRSRSQGLSHEVAVFSSVEASVAAYMRNLNSNAAYSLFRKIRADLREKGETPIADQLVYGLINYSERQQAYINELLSLLRHNKKYLVENHEQKPAV